MKNWWNKMTPKKKCTVSVSTCRDCPHFDNTYYTYEHTCMMLGKVIEADKEDRQYKIPEDCPLPDWTKE